MADEKLTAATRIEKLLDNIAGGENDVTPATRLEKFLSYIADAMEGGGSGGCECGLFTVTLTKTQDGFTIDKTHDEITQLLEAGKRPIAYIDNLGGTAGIVMSNQYITGGTAIIFTFEYTTKEPEQAGLTYVSRVYALLPNNTVNEVAVTTITLEDSPNAS